MLFIDFVVEAAKAIDEVHVDGFIAIVLCGDDDNGLSIPEEWRRKQTAMVWSETANLECFVLV